MTSGLVDSGDAGSISRPTHILDDDPTGTQSVQDAPVVLWPHHDGVEPNVLWNPVVYHLTNTRALSPSGAGDFVARVADRIIAAEPSARIVLRGDSTLRGHMYEEYLAVAEVAFRERPVLLLVPAMPDAGRVTINGVHQVDDGRTRKPVASTPYAADPRLGYSNSHLLAWAEERSGGALSARRGAVVALGDLRTRGVDAIVESLIPLSRSGIASVCAVDAETNDDLRIIAKGLLAAEEAGADVLVRSAPPFAAILGECLATSLRPVPRSDKVLVVCGSFVPLATRQLASLSGEYPGAVVEADLDALLESPASEQARVADRLDTQLRRADVAILATPRRPPTSEVPFGDSLRIAENLAGALRQMTDLPPVVVAKGGVTSATVASAGLAADTAWVEGPAMTGVATWRVGERDSAVRLLVVPGNVGSDDLLTELVSNIVRPGHETKW
ncbi:MAG: four-carbon acid sugar kinase family protein [Acidimicrobiia bacterium]|nr:MAG: four-carbon acid sugar kinase family protein [Acidimicrobiia bacterium]